MALWLSDEVNNKLIKFNNQQVDTSRFVKGVGVGTPALFFYSVLCFFNKQIILRGVEKGKEKHEISVFSGAKKGDVPYMYTKMGVLRKI